MATIVLQCTQCRSKQQTIDLAPISRAIDDFSVSSAGFCRSCYRPIGLILRAKNCAATADAVVNYIARSSNDCTSLIDVVGIYPSEIRDETPEYLPDSVRRAFSEAESCNRGGNYVAAIMMYRKALDMATKDKGNEIPDLHHNLAKRLKQLTRANILTPDIADWADHIKDLGNEAAHEDAVPTSESVAGMAAITRMTLVYLYELPGRVAALREAAEMT